MSSAEAHRLRPLGQSGLEVSPLTLGAANFGSKWGVGWTLSLSEAADLLRHAVENGIEAVDTANIYNQGESEIWLGDLLKRENLRNRVLLSTKFGYRNRANIPHSGGSGRKAMFFAVEESLHRLGTDVIDILYLQIWDRRTPIEETLEAAEELAKAGKVRAFGVSNVPSWYLARADIIGLGPQRKRVSAIQLNYNLLTRHVEQEFCDVLKMTGTGLTVWGPLADGLLTGKYEIDSAARIIVGQGRVSSGRFTTSQVDPFEPRVQKTLQVVNTICQETGYTPSQIALSWLLAKPHVSSVIIGVTSLDQLLQNARAVSLQLDPEILDRLDAVTFQAARYPYTFLEPQFQLLVHGIGKLPA